MLTHTDIFLYTLFYDTGAAEIQLGERQNMGKFLRAKAVQGTNRELFIISQGTGINTEQRHFDAAVTTMEECSRDQGLDLSQPQPECVVFALGAFIKKMIAFEESYARENGLEVPLTEEHTLQLAHYVYQHPKGVEHALGWNF